MNNKFYRKIVIGFIALFIVLAIVLMILINLLNNTNSSQDNLNKQNEGGSDFLADYGTTQNGGVDEQAYYDVKACMEKYLNTINSNNKEYTYCEETEVQQKIFNILSEKYIQDNNIRVDNIYNFVKLLQYNVKFIPFEIVQIQDEEIRSFLVHGGIGLTDNYNGLVEIFTIVNIDISQGCFSIEPIYNNYSDISEIKITEFENKISKNKNNEFHMAYITRENVAKDYVETFKRLTLSYPRKMYELLDEEYKTAKFGNFETFKRYVENNKSKIEKIMVEKYQIFVDENYNLQYVCLDQNENYYIFKEKDVLQDYSVMLDTYTIDLPEFTEKYNAGNEQTKVGMNIQKIINAINDKDYKYVYSKLDDSFKQKNYPTVEDLQKYIETNFFDENDIEYLQFSQESSAYLFKTRIKEKSVQNPKRKILTVVMKLEDGNDFKMSFSM